MENQNNLEKLNEKVSQILQQYNALKGENEMIRTELITLKAEKEIKDQEIEKLTEQNVMKDLEIEEIVNKMCHTPADIFQVKERGYLKEGYYADIVLVDPEDPWTINKSNLYYKCGWSPMEGMSMKSRVTHTFVNGNLVFDNGIFDESTKGKALEFNR